MQSADPVPSPAPALPPRIVFFDGVCGFCDHMVQWLMDQDPQGRLRFAPLQGECADAIRACGASDFPADLDSLAFVEWRGAPGDPLSPESLHIRVRSQAVLAILAELPGPARHWAHARILPRWLTDLAYRAFARIRYRVFGKLDACAMPTPEQRARFLD